MSKKQNYLQPLMSEFGVEPTGEIIPLLSKEEEAEMMQEEFGDELPILPIRNTVLFPGVVIPITVGRKKSLRLIRDAGETDGLIGVVAQVRPEEENPSASDLSKVGTVARIMKTLTMPDGNVTIFIQGRRRFEIVNIITEKPYFVANVNALGENFDTGENASEAEALQVALKDVAKQIIALSPEIPGDARIAVDNIETLSFLTHFLCSNARFGSQKKQELLEIENGIERATDLLSLMTQEVQLLELKTEIQSKVHSDIDQQQRDYFLRQQMKVLQDELGEEGGEQDVVRLRERAVKKEWPENVRKHFDKELKRIARMNSSSPDFAVSMNYAEFLLDLPWGETTKDNFDLKRGKRILDKEHYGLDKVKQRILEYLAVLKLKRELKGGDEKMRGPILCLYGPPGVGKTSLGKSIAKALNREYVRMSLGGVHDESEVRGHRKTYVGAMAGKVIQNIKKAGTSNPVFVLDEIDKVSSDFRGDPSSALLEVLDPEQNENFVDNYLEIEYDLSKTLFIATSNSLDTIQPALRDRMEIIELSGYTLDEKVEIVKRHLIPRQLEEHGLDKKVVTITKPAIIKVIEQYTRESGVRSLERKIGAIFRYVAKSIALEEEYPSKIKPTDISKILGAEVFEKEGYEENEMAGVVTGLAWTSVGGEILSIESILSRGKGKLTLSGQLGDVMKESAMTALSNLRAHADKLDIDYRIFDQYDLHIHFPAGAVPKDGPSAGITIYTSLASLFTQRKVRSRLAMTGEITLSGKVLPVGGIKEKVLAAKRAGISDVIMCHKNRKDVEEIAEGYLEGLTIHYVKNVQEVIDFALLDEKVDKPLNFVISEENEK
ncbi:MAG: endopeptidase La [Cytophagales bacterium]|nr:endopeptidase La [Cytophagales bacterium]